MSRTIKGSKPCGYDFWAKRPGNKGGAGGKGRFAKKMTHKIERQNNKPTLSELLELYLP